MKKILLVLIALLTPSFGVLAQSAGSSSLNDPIYAFMGNGGYDALDYNINLRFASDKKTLVGTTTMEAVATQDLSAFNLDFGSMTVSNVVVNGSSARFTQADPEMTISPSEPLRLGQRFKVSVVYSGMPNSVAIPSTQWFLSQTGLTVLAEPSLMFTWSPVNDHPADKALFTLVLTSSLADTAISNGTFLGRTENTDGTATSSYRIGTPTSTYFVVMAVGAWKLQEDGVVGNTRIRHYLARGTSNTMYGAIAETKNIVQFFSEKLIPYPFAEAGVLTSDNNLGYALETQGLITMPTTWSDDTLIRTTETVAHEFAHQWFGAMVTFKNHDDMFLHEGFATYLGWVFTAERFSSFVSSKYIEEKIQSFYPSAVHGRYAIYYSHSDLMASLRYNMGFKYLSKENVDKILTLLFTNSLPVETRAALLARVPESGWVSQEFINAIDDLPFEKIVLLSRNFYEIVALTGGAVSNFATNWDEVTPPAALKKGNNLFNRGVYQRGATALHALRLKIGSDAFWALLRGYLEKYKFSNASNNDWLEFVQSRHGQEIRDFHESWIRSDAVPDFPELGLKATDYKLGADFK
jgi:aminopeptidase N